MLSHVLVPESGQLILKDMEAGKEIWATCLGHSIYTITSIVYDLTAKPIAYSGFITENNKIVPANWSMQGIFFYQGTESNNFYNLIIMEPVIKPVPFCEKEAAICETISELVDLAKERNEIKETNQTTEYANTTD